MFCIQWHSSKDCDITKAMSEWTQYLSELISLMVDDSWYLRHTSSLIIYCFVLFIFSVPGNLEFDMKRVVSHMKVNGSAFVRRPFRSKLVSVGKVSLPLYNGVVDYFYVSVLCQVCWQLSFFYPCFFSSGDINWGDRFSQGSKLHELVRLWRRISLWPLLQWQVSIGLLSRLQSTKWLLELWLLRVQASLPTSSVVSFAFCIGRFDLWSHLRRSLP